MAPATGPGAVRTSPYDVSSADRLAAWSASRARNRQVGPEPETSEARAPAWIPACNGVARSGRSESEASWRSLESAAARSGHEPAASAPRRSTEEGSVGNEGDGTGRGREGP